jgi:hypothetical protein
MEASWYMDIRTEPIAAADICTTGAECSVALDNSGWDETRLGGRQRRGA